MLAQMDDLVVHIAIQAGLGEHGPGRKMAGCRSLIAEGKRLAADVVIGFHRTLRVGNEDRTVGRLAINNADAERLDIGCAGLGENIGKRTEITDLDPSEAHRLYH